jgi:hypothetical protein
MAEKKTPRRRVRVDGAAEPEAAREEAPACSCPQLDPDDWHEVESDWTDIQFIRSALPAVVGVPMGYQSVREKLARRAEEAGAEIPEDAMLLLGEGRVRRPVMLEVEASADTPGLEAPGGIAWTRLLSASFGQMKLLTKETRELAKERYGREPDDFWIWYLTCSTCSQARDWETLFVAHYREG